MKITAILLLATCLQVSATGHAQSVTLNLKNAPLEKVFAAIEKQTEYSFVYTDQLLQKAKKVDVDVTAASLAEVLLICFKDQPYSYVISDKFIVVKFIVAPSPLEHPKDGSAARGDEALPISLRIRVTDADNNPLAGATISINKKPAGKTDAEGVLSLNVSVGDVLSLSFVGYENQSLTISSQSSTLSIVLKRNESQLDEVVVNKGYYTEKQRFSVSNVGKVTSKDIEKQPVNNPLLALEGRVPGLFITQANGLPGSGVKVRIQGQNSLINGNSPLYIVDGVPFPGDIPPNNGRGPLGNSGENTGTGNALSFLNTNDIESIEILKDADATAIYGSRAANGAILITTKKGKAGKSRVEANFQQGWGKVTRTMEMMNTRQYLDMRYEALRNDNLFPTSNASTSAPFIYAPDLTIWDTTRYTNWKDVLIGGISKYTNINASITGGTAAAQYRIGGTFKRETTVFPGDYSDVNGSMFFNLNNSSANQKFRFNLSSSYSFDNNKLPSGDLTEAAMLLAPNAPALFNVDGSLNWAPNSVDRATWTNPMGAFLYQTYQAKTNSLVTSTNLCYRIFPELEISANMGYTNILTKDWQLNPLIALKPERWPTARRTAFYGNRNLNTWIIEPQGNYKLKLGTSKLDFLLGATFQQTGTDAGIIGGSGYANDQIMKNPAAAGALASAGQVKSLYRYNAFFGRVNYNFKDKYIINLTGRRDGSSRFGDNNKFHNFGSVGAAWIFTEEALVKKSSFLTFGKLKASYGTTGSDQIGDYRFLSLYSNITPPIGYQGITGLAPGDIPNPYLEWEETKKIDIGIDLAFLNNRISLGANYNRNRSSNQLVSYSLPTITGRSDVVSNFPATIENIGWEFSLSTINVRSNKINWSTNFNLTIPRNKLVDFPNLAASSYASIYVIGQPVDVQKLTHFLGVDPTTGLYIVADKDGNPTTSSSSKDQTVLVSSFASYYGGLQNSIQYKGFQVDFLIQFVKQKGAASFFSNSQAFVAGLFSTGIGFGNQPAALITQSHWQKPGDVATIQQFSADNSSVDDALAEANSSDAAFKDAAYGRLKNLSISWELPSNWKRKIQFQNCKLFIQAQNLITISGYKGLDPENQSFTSLPPLRIITVGFQAGL
ncbi:MAG: SusC/RagA family TonB-linked outer membrane protein [Chitinophagaceae bacterium]